MPKSIPQQEVTVLTSAKNGLVYLTANDCTLLADKATRRKFKAGEVVVPPGRRTYGVYLLLTGSATVQIPTGQSPSIGPGEVCGEISFLDDLPATATVTAQEPLEVLYLDRPTLQSVFELFPHLGSRFYRSLACSLSRRLREMIGTGAANEA